MSPACALHVIRMHRTSVDRRERVSQLTRLVQPVGVQRHGDIKSIRNGERIVDEVRESGHILMYLKPSASRKNVSFQGGWIHTAASPQERNIYGNTFERCQEHGQISFWHDALVPHAPVSHAHEGGRACGKRRVDQTGAGHMHVTVHSPSRRNEPFRRNEPGVRADNQIDCVDIVWIPRAPQSSTSSPYEASSRSISMIRFVSASRRRSPTVGPYKPW